MSESPAVSEHFFHAAHSLCARIDADGGRQLLSNWTSGAFATDDAARTVALELSRRCRSRASSDHVSSVLPRGIADVVMVWAESAAARPDLQLAPLLGRDNAARSSFRSKAAKARLLRGPLHDALAALPAAWDGDLGNDGRLRLQQLVWEAGARGMTLPALGRWVMTVPKAAAALILDPARGHLGERALAARAFAVFADGFSEDVAPGMTRELLRVGVELRDHAEPVVWRPAAQGLGRFARDSQAARMTVFRAVTDARLSVRRRNLASIAALPVTIGAEGWIYEQFQRVFDPKVRRDDPWQLAALAVATPHLTRERPDVWVRLCSIALEEPAVELTWSIAQGLAALAREEAGRGLNADETRVAQSLRAQLETVTPTATNEIARKFDALISLDRALGNEPAAHSCFDAYDTRICADIDGRGAPEPALPRMAFDDAMSRLDAADDVARGAALLALRSATRAHAMHLPELVLGLRSLEVDSDEMMEACRKRLAAEPGEYGVRSALVGAICDLVAGSEVHGRAAARALRAVAESRWVLDLGDLAAEAARSREVKREVQRFRKPLEDLFETCLAARPALANVGDNVTVPPVVAAWWTLCAGPAAVLGRIDRLPQGNPDDSLEHRIARLEAILRDAMHLSAGDWGPRALDALSALGADDTALLAALSRLVDALTQVETAVDVDETEMRRILGMLASSTRALVALGTSLDDALAPVAVAGGLAASAPAWVSTPLSAGQTMDSLVQVDSASDSPWNRLGPLLRMPVATQAEALLARFRANPPFVPESGKRVANYVLEELISEGGMGQVWRASSVGLPGDVMRPVALKLPKLDVPKPIRARLAKALHDEARIQAQFSAARVSTMLDYGVIGDVPYLVTALLRGCNAEEYFVDDEAADPAGRHLPLVQRVVRDVCIGLENMHRHGVLHRDLKPGNIMLRMRGRHSDPILSIGVDPQGEEIDEAVLIDLGIAHKFYETGEGGATPGYAAPELVSEVPVGPAADVYALGATLFHILTGRRLTGDLQQLPAILWHVETEPFTDPTVLALARPLPARIQEALAGACKRAPEERISLQQFRSLVCRF